jgi:hypothetical protein
VLRLQLGGHPMLVRVASTTAQDEAQACPASTSMQPDPGTSSVKHPSVVTQIWPKPHVSGALPPASAPGQSALGGGHWNVRLGEHVPPSEPPPRLEPEPDAEPWPEPVPELAPELEPDPEPLAELGPPPPLELLPQARPEAARASAAVVSKDVTVRTGQALSLETSGAYRDAGSRESRRACRPRSLRHVQRRTTHRHPSPGESHAHPAVRDSGQARAGLGRHLRGGAESAIAAAIATKGLWCAESSLIETRSLHRSQRPVSQKNRSLPDP